MTKQKSTKRALLMSALALLMCVSMLIGSTFAWFTDSVTSGSNKIVAGSLDVQLLMYDGSNYADISDSGKPIFGAGSIAQNNNAETLWEPGKTQVAYLAIKNNGSLALKYKVALDVQNVSKNLYEVMEYAIIPDAMNGSVKSWTDGNSVVEGMQNVSSDVSLAVGATHYFALAIHMDEEAGNEYQGGEVNFDLTVLAAQDTVESDSFNNQYDANAEYDALGVTVTPNNIATIDFSVKEQTFVFKGTFDAVSISDIGNGSVLDLGSSTFGNLTLGSDATITGAGTLNNIETVRNGAEAVTLNITDATLDVTGNINVKNTDNKSVLNITNSEVTCGWIFVGEHTNNHQAALAEFNVINSVVSVDEMTDVPDTQASLGSTIGIWGKSGVSAKIYDSEIYTYSRGWHQSEDANDNSITFQGDEFINVDIQRSNMHLYGARSIVNARPYNDHDGNCEVNFTIDESLIWVVTKSNHGENTLPVWGATEITDSMLLFTKNRSTDPIFKSFVYGNPVIHGDYHITTQCEWDADIVLADGQTVTFASDANVSIYDGAGNVQFVKNGSAKVVLEDGAVVKNIGGLN